jgi:hypothetical protein
VLEAKVTDEVKNGAPATPDPAVTPKVPTTPTSGVFSGTSEAALDPKWVDTFYRECGREVTLAYTTLNQMKNWAMTITAAALSGLAFGTASKDYPNKSMFVGVVLVYVFVLRFYVRAILCYINLLRWNRLQTDCIELNLVPRIRQGAQPKQEAELELQLREDIQHYYFEWLSPIDRKTQLFSNLKLGFGLVFALTLLFLFWGLLNLWQERLVKALFIFAVGTTLVELNDFLKSRFFDTIDASQKRKDWSKAQEIFPVPGTRGWYLASWLFVIVVSIMFAEWPAITLWLRTSFCHFCRF